MLKQHKYNQQLPENKYNPLSWIHPDAVIGDNCWIGSDVMISANVELKDNVSISCGCKIYDHDTSRYRVTEGRIQAKHYKVVIGSHTQIGSNSVIVPKGGDIIIGDHVIVGALSLVRESISPHSVAVGIPAKVIMRIEEGI